MTPETKAKMWYLAIEGGKRDAADLPDDVKMLVCQMYASDVKMGLKTLDQVPEAIRDIVKHLVDNN